VTDEFWQAMERSAALAPLDATVPNSARMWDYWLRGKDNYEIDRVTADEIAVIAPGINEGARASRAFLCRAVRWMASSGVDQFLDIGCGFPGVDNTHQIAQSLIPAARVVYVDNDALVLAHACALLTSGPDGVCAHVGADLREPEDILTQAKAALDLSRPVGLLLLGVLEQLGDDAQALSVVWQLVEALAPGSLLAVSHLTDQIHGPAMHEALRCFTARGGIPMVARTPAQIAGFFDGLELVEPGVVSCSRWRPEHGPWGEPAEVPQLCGVGRKPSRESPN
jgi:hypothetical protein